MKQYFRNLIYLAFFCVLSTQNASLYAVDSCGGTFSNVLATVVAKDNLEIRVKRMDNLLNLVDFFSTAIRRHEFDSITRYNADILNEHNWFKANSGRANSGSFSLNYLRVLLTKLERRISELDQQYEGFAHSGEESETYREAIVSVLGVLIEQNFDILTQLRKRELELSPLDSYEQGIALQVEAVQLRDNIAIVNSLHRRISVLPLLVRFFYIYSEPSLYTSAFRQLDELQKNGRSREYYKKEIIRVSRLPSEALRVGYSYYLGSGSLASLLIMSTGISRFPEEKVRNSIQKLKSQQGAFNDTDLESLVTEWVSNFGARSMLGSAINKLLILAPEGQNLFMLSEDEWRLYFPESLIPQVKSQLSRIKEKGSLFDKRVYGHILQTWIRYQKSIN